MRIDEDEKKRNFEQIMNQYEELYGSEVPEESSMVSDSES